MEAMLLDGTDYTVVVLDAWLEPAVSCANVAVRPQRWTLLTLSILRTDDGHSRIGQGPRETFM